MSKRIAVAAATQRIPVGALKEKAEERDGEIGPPQEAERRSARKALRSVGRPRKDAADKARNVSITLWPEELDALDALLARINAELPAEVTRSDVARLGLAPLMEKSPQDIIQGLTKLRKRKR